MIFEVLEIVHSDLGIDTEELHDIRLQNVLSAAGDAM